MLTLTDSGRIACLVADPRGAAGNLSGILGGLTLSVVEIGRYGNDRISYGFAEVIFSGFLHFLQNYG